MFTRNTNLAARTLTRVLCLGAALAAPALLRADTLDYSNGFKDLSGFAVNQSSSSGHTWNALNNSALVLTDANGFEREAVFSKTAVNVSQFTTSFDFQIQGNPGWMADGLTFCIQNQGLTALGGPGGGLGFGPDPYGDQSLHIAKSVAVKFDIYQNLPDPSNNSTGLFTNGACPIGGYDLTPYKIDLHSGDRFHVDMAYDGKVLKVLLTDTVTQANAWQTYVVDIPTTVGGTSAYVGFTGATGGAVSEIRVLGWDFNAAALKPALSSVAINTDTVCGGLSAQGTVTLQQSMPSDTLVTLSSGNPMAIVPKTVTVPAGQTGVTFPIKTLVTPKSTSVSIAATVDVTMKTSLMVMPLGVDSVGVQADYIPAGQLTTGTVTLQMAAAPGPMTVQLTSADPHVAGVPATVLVGAGQTSVSFPIQTGAVLSNTPVLITANLNGSTRTTTLTVRPLRVNSLTTSVATVSGGKFFVATVSLEAPATAGGVTINLSANGSCVQLPASVVVPAGATSFSFPVTTSSVKASTTVTLTASSPVNNVYAAITVTK